MAFGLPVVAFDLPETAALIADAGVLAPPEDVERLARHIAALLDDPNRRAALGMAGRRRVAAELAREIQASTYLSVIERAVAARRRGGCRSAAATASMDGVLVAGRQEDSAADGRETRVVHSPMLSVPDELPIGSWALAGGGCEDDVHA